MAGERKTPRSFSDEPLAPAIDVGVFIDGYLQP
jgi:hypothetical protein